jgi:hypothetical protein
MLLLVALATPQSLSNSRPLKHAPILGFAQTSDAPPILDTDLLAEQKYIEEAGADPSRVKAKRAAHEALLTREFMEGFNDARECDDVILSGKGDNKPDFALQIRVDSHDTLEQKPIWAWVLRDLHSNKLLPLGEEESGKQAAKGICLAVLKAGGR